MLDANILMAGIGWPRFPHEVLRHALKNDFHVVLSREIVEDARKYIQASIGHEALLRFEQFLADAEVEIVDDPSPEELAQHPDLVRDPDDIAVALAAIHAQVDYLISQDRDLTDPGEPIHQYLAVRLPGTFLREQMGWTSEALEQIRHRTWADFDDTP